MVEREQRRSADVRTVAGPRRESHCASTCQTSRVASKASSALDYIITVPNYPRHVVGRAAVAELYRPYGETFVLDRCFDLAVHRDRDTGVVVLEYASEGRAVRTGAAYSNRYVSVLTISARKVTRWRDYLDPIPVFDAVGWPAPRPRVS
jgi:ketosteroid isomerase-like protein